MTRITAISSSRTVVRIGAVLFGLVTLVALGQAGPFVVNAVAATAVPVVTKTPFVPIGPDGKPIPVGSGTVVLVLPPRYTHGAAASSASITEYICNGRLAPASGSGPEELAIGVRGMLGGHSWFAFFSATRTLIGFENISLTPAMIGGPLGTFTADAKAAARGGAFTGQVAGTTSLTAPGFSGRVTANLTCARPAGATNVTTPAATPSHNGSSSSGTLITIGLAILIALASVVIASLTRGKSKRPDELHKCARAQAEVQAAEAEVAEVRARGDAHYRSLGDLRVEGVVLGAEDNEEDKFSQETEAAIAKATRAAEERLARAREALRICLAGGPDFAPVDGVDPLPQGFDPVPPKSGGSDDDPTERQEIG